MLMDEFLKRNREKTLNIHCLGDCVIDEYYDVKVNRISPEFPGLIMSSNDDWCVRRPGAAANVAYQLKYLNTNSWLMCWCDDALKSVLIDHGIKWAHPLASERCSLPVKRRYLDSGVQIIRHDLEVPFCGLDDFYIDACTVEIARAIGQTFVPDVAILSDYNKGFFSSDKHNVINLYKGSKTIVDPKKGPLSKWKGCTIFKPNCKEAFELTGLSNWEDQAKFIQQQLECEAVVITCGGEGVCGIADKELFTFTPSKTVVVESVIGAGDCFAAFFAVAIGHDFHPLEAAEIAWNAGAKYVQTRCNRPIVPAELSESRTVDPIDLANRDFKLVLTNGCFDILHEGHLKTLEFAKSKGDKLVVALNSDASVERLKGKGRPVKPLDQRMAVMGALNMVDFVVSFDEDTPLELIKKINPDVLVKGGGYSVETIVGADIVPEVYTIPLVKDLSTTSILDRSV